MYVFKIVPCLNPDGAMIGNFRSSLTGTDLNRRWDMPDKHLHPQIYYFKQYLRKITVEDGKEILVFCDLHGHGRKSNSFVYGCDKAAKGGFCSWTKVRLLPRIVAKKTPLFSYKDCTFRVESDKQRTARVVVWKELSVTNSFTLESSFYGYNRGDEIVPYSDEDYFKIGETLLDSLLEYSALLKQIEIELIITKGWLKPSKLIQLTGIPAADLLKKKLAVEKQMEKKKKRLERIKQFTDEKKVKTKFKNKSLSSAKKRKNEISLKDVQAISTTPCRECISQLSTLKKSLHKKQLETTLPLISPHSDTNIMKADYKDVEIKLKSRSRMHSLKGIDLHENANTCNNLEDEPNELSENVVDWRQYFSNEEMVEAYSQIVLGFDPNDLEKIPSVENSESCESDEAADLSEKILKSETIAPKPEEVSPQCTLDKQKTNDLLSLTDNNKLIQLTINRIPKMRSRVSSNACKSFDPCPVKFFDFPAKEDNSHLFKKRSPIKRILEPISDIKPTPTNEPETNEKIYYGYMANKVQRVTNTAKKNDILGLLIDGTKSKKRNGSESQLVIQSQKVPGDLTKEKLVKSNMPDIKPSFSTSLRGEYSNLYLKPSVNINIKNLNVLSSSNTIHSNADSEILRYKKMNGTSTVQNSIIKQPDLKLINSKNLTKQKSSKQAWDQGIHHIPKEVKQDIMKMGEEILKSGAPKFSGIRFTKEFSSFSIK